MDGRITYNVLYNCDRLRLRLKIINNHTYLGTFGVTDKQTVQLTDNTDMW